MSITKVYIPDYELDYLEAKPDRSSAAYSRQEVIWEDPKSFHEFVDLTAIWHDASEEPKRGSLILLIMPSGTAIVAKIIEPNHTFNHGERWAYISDLLPKGGAE